MKFPGLISGCTMDWFSRWPRDALIAVSEHFLQNFEIICTPEVKRELILLVADVHNSVSLICKDYFDR